MDRSKRTWWLGGLAGVAAIAGILVAVLVGGGDPARLPQPGEAFQDADQRFHVAVDEPISRTHTFDVPQGVAAMTVTRSLELPEGGEWQLQEPDGTLRGTVSPQLEGERFVEPEGSLVVHRPEAGTWRMTVECNAGCEYALGVYISDALDWPEDGLRQDVAPADTVVHLDHEEPASGEETFVVPEDTQALELTVSFYTADGGLFRIDDPSGDRQTRWNWPAEWLTRGTNYVLVEEPASGTWTIVYDCNVACEAAWGLRFG